MKNLCIYFLILSVSQPVWAESTHILAPNEEVLTLSESVNSGEVQKNQAIQRLQELEENYRFNATDKNIILKYVDSDYHFKSNESLYTKSQIEKDLTQTSSQNYEKEFSLSKNEKILMGILIFALGTHLLLESQNKELVFSF